MKFGRLYSMSVQGASDTHRVDFPLTVRFQTRGSTTFSMGTGVFLVYNLTADVRNDIYKDICDVTAYRQVVFSAGYQSDSANPGAINLPIIYQGNVLQAFSYRQGPDWITEIHALDGGFAVDNATINLSKPAPWNYNDALTDMVNALKPFGLKLGLIGAFDFNNRTRGISFSGNVWDLISQSVSPLLGQAFINKEVVYIVQQWEFIEDLGTLDVINTETGMIGTPRVQDHIVTARLLFEPRIEFGQQISLETDDPNLDSRANGPYKVLEVRHRGTISGAFCETAETEVIMYNPEVALAAA